jgi:hypothetical protein
MTATSSMPASDVDKVLAALLAEPYHHVLAQATLLVDDT